MQILVFEATGYKIVSGIFSFVARVYDVMLNLSKQGQDAGTIKEFAFSDIASVMYAIAGVFMLFRVTIAMINMLINPDAINDGKAGAGKLLTRIVTSILMLIAFIPNGWIFGDEGILNRVETAVLSDGGLIEKILPDSIGGSSGDDSNSTSGDSNSDSSNSESTSSNSNSVSDASKAAIQEGADQVKNIAEQSAENTKSGLAMSGLFDNVYAAQSKMECYYVFVSHNYNDGAVQKITAGDENSTLNKSKIGISKVLHLTLYSDNESGTGKLCTDGVFSNDCKKYSYTADTSSPYSKFTNNIVWSGLNDGWPSSYNCPNTITEKGKAKDSNKNWDDESNGGNYVGGWHSESAMATAVAASDSTANAIGNNAEAIRKLLGLSGGAYLSGVSGDAISFAQMAMGTFISCDNESKCKDLKAETLVTNGKNIIDGWKNDSIGLDFIPAVIAGVGILIWVLVLCVDIIIRRFKLLLLQMIAPIPIICYVDPNDQIFEKWRKMYTSTYLDLFIKLIAIAFAIVLLRMVSGLYQNNDETILKFFYIVAILVFAKAIPSMISEIFGIKNMGGSFKDITGMAKAAAGFGAGAAIGLGAGAITGGMAFHATKGQGIGNRLLAGASAVGSGITGAARGAGAGSKGKVLAGAKDIAALNANRRAKYASGLTPSHLLEAATVGKIGMDYASRADREVAPLKEKEEALMNLVKNKGKMEEVAMGSQFMRSVLGERANGFNISDNALDKLRDEWIGAQLKGESGADFTRRMTSGDNGLLYADLFSRMESSGFSFDNFKDGAKTPQLVTEMKNINASLAGSPSIAGTVGFAGGIDEKDYSQVQTMVINSWNGADIKDASGNVVGKTQGINAIQDQIRAKTVGDPRYNASKGAKTAAVNDKK